MSLPRRRWVDMTTEDFSSPEVARWIGVYRRYYGFYFSDTAEADPQTYAWCLRQLDAG